MSGSQDGRVVMQSSESQGHRDESVDSLVALVVTAGRRGVRLTAALLWIAVGGYTWLWPVVALPYTVGLVGWSVGLALSAALLGDRSDAYSGGFLPQSRRHTWLDRVLLVGCVFGIVGGTIGVSITTEQLTASQLTAGQLLLSPVVAGTLVGVSLLVLAGRLYGPVVAGLAVVTIGGVGLTTPRGGPALVETMVFSSGGIYGPLTRVAAIWIAPACLLVGLWRATGTVDQLRDLFPKFELSKTGWLTATNRLKRGSRQLTLSSMGFVAVLIAWQSVGAGYLVIVGATAVPAAVLWVGGGVAVDFTGRRPNNVGQTRSWQAWCGLLLMAGGPIALMTVLLVSYRQPIGTVLVAGCLLLVGLCTVGPLVERITGVDREQRLKEDHQSGLRTGARTVLDGSVAGVTHLAQIVVLLATVGGVVSVLQVGGVSTWLASTALWVTGSRTVLVFAALASVCVALGMVLPMLGGYAVGALLVVPLFQTLTSVPELLAHLVVWYAVVVGGVVGPGLWIRARSSILAMVQQLN